MTVQHRDGTNCNDARCFSCQHNLSENELFALTVKTIAEHGTQIIGLAEATPAFAYTIGLDEEFEHPEIIVFGLPMAFAVRYLNIFREEIRGGKRFEADHHYIEYTENGLPSLFKPVHSSQIVEYCGYGVRYYEHRQSLIVKTDSSGERVSGAESSSFRLPRFLQMFWCDKLGRFPWVENFQLPPEKFRQPFLWLPSDEYRRRNAALS